MKGRQALAEVTDGTAALAITVVALVGARAVAVQPKKKAKAKAQAQPRDDGEELNSRARREEWRAPLPEENRELRTEITQQRVELRMEAGQGRTRRDEAQTLRSEYVEARSEEAALKTVLKLQQSINDCSQQQMLQLRSEYSSALESQQHELHELDQVEASRMVYQLCESSVRCMRSRTGPVHRADPEGVEQAGTRGGRHLSLSTSSFYVTSRAGRVPRADPEGVEQAGTRGGRHLSLSTSTFYVRSRAGRVPRADPEGFDKPQTGGGRQ